MRRRIGKPILAHGRGDSNGAVWDRVRSRLCRALITVLSAALLLAPGFAGAAPTPAATAMPPAVATPPPTVTDIVLGITASEGLQRATLARLEQAGLWRELADRVAVLEARFDALPAGTAATGELIDAITRARQLRALHGDVSTVIDELGLIARQFEHDRRALESDARKWREGLLLVQDDSVPAPIRERAASMETKLGATNARVREHQNAALVALERAVALQVRVDDARALVAAQEERIRSQRVQLEQSSLWQIGAAPARLDVVADEVATAWRSLGTYFARDGAYLAALFVGILALTGRLFLRGSRGAGTAQHAYGRPVAASLLIALMSLWWLAPDPPTLFYEALLVLLPIPAAMVARGALGRATPLTVYGIALATVLIPLRSIIEGSAIADRILLLIQAISIAAPVAVDLYNGQLQRALRRLSPGAVRAAGLLVLVAAAVTVFHVIFGFTGPGRSLRAGMGSILGFGLVFGATAVALYGASLALFASPPFRWLRSARNADPAMLRTLRVVLGLLAVAGVVIVTVGIYGLVPTMQLAAQSLMGATLEVGTVSIAAKAIVTALGVAIATVVLTGLTRFLLEREVVPRLGLRPGAGFAMVTFTRWAIVIVGAALTLAALGIDMAKITLLASAVGVGIGFGLQNVVNNFVSGLILIVERPVGVGDLIEIGPLAGEVKRIGIRSSTVRTGQGAEVIVPNGDLVSKEVVNWTRSDRQRRYDIDVGVDPDSDPERVMRLLVEAAGDVPEIMTSPAPRAMFKGFGDSALNFSLLAWVPTVDVGLQAQNALRVAILRKLAAAGIAIPFPQRDVHIHSVDDHAHRATT
jgi:small-conductance mechanosensitive channel